MIDFKSRSATTPSSKDLEGKPDATAAPLQKVIPATEEDLQQELPSTIKAILYGISGTGKSAAAATLAFVPEVKHVHLLAVESNAMAGLKAGFEIHKVKSEDRKKFSALRIASGRRNISALLSSANSVLLNPLDDLAKKPDLMRSKYTRYTEVLKGMQNFVDTNGKDHGSIMDWGKDTVVYIDGMTVIMEVIQQTIIGGKVLLSQPNRGILQNMLMSYIRFLTEEVQCHVVLLAHPVRQKSDITGLESIFIGSSGQALKDTLPSAFTDVIYTTKNGNNYYWNSSYMGAITSARNIRQGEKLPPSFTEFDWDCKELEL